MIGTFSNPSKRSAFPCYNCSNRKVGCHAKCDAYKAAAKMNERTNENCRKETFYHAKHASDLKNRKLFKRIGKKKTE